MIGYVLCAAAFLAAGFTLGCVGSHRALNEERAAMRKRVDRTMDEWLPKLERMKREREEALREAQAILADVQAVAGSLKQG